MFVIMADSRLISRNRENPDLLYETGKFISRRVSKSKKFSCETRRMTFSDMSEVLSRVIYNMRRWNANSWLIKFHLKWKLLGTPRFNHFRFQLFLILFMKILRQLMLCPDEISFANYFRNYEHFRATTSTKCCAVMSRRGIAMRALPAKECHSRRFVRVKLRQTWTHALAKMVLGWYVEVKLERSSPLTAREAWRNTRTSPKCTTGSGCRISTTLSRWSTTTLSSTSSSECSTLSLTTLTRRKLRTTSRCSSISSSFNRLIKMQLKFLAICSRKNQQAQRFPFSPRYSFLSDH